MFNFGMSRKANKQRRAERAERRVAERHKIERNIAQLLSVEREEPLPDELPAPPEETPQQALQKSRRSFFQLLEPPQDKQRRKRWFIRNIVALAGLVILAVAAILLGADKPAVAAVLVGFGLLAHLFSGLLALLGLIPVVGPLLVATLSLPFIWLMNGIGYLVSAKMVAQGKGREVLNWRTVTIVFIAGAALGIVIGRLLPN